LRRQNGWPKAAWGRAHRCARVLPVAETAAGVRCGSVLSAIAGDLKCQPAYSTEFLPHLSLLPRKGRDLHWTFARREAVVETGRRSKVFASASPEFRVLPDRSAGMGPAPHQETDYGTQVQNSHSCHCVGICKPSRPAVGLTDVQEIEAVRNARRGRRLYDHRDHSGVWLATPHDPGGNHWSAQGGSPDRNNERRERDRLSDRLDGAR